MFEKVNPAHPDKIADRIAGALVDLAYSKAENPRIAVEVLIGHDECNIIAESSEEITLADAQKIVERITGIKGINVRLKCVPQDKHLAKNQSERIKCGDNGIFCGMPTTKEQAALVQIAKNFYASSGNSDGKYIIDLDNEETPLVICQSNLDDCEYGSYSILELLSNEEGILFKKYPIVNPLGKWTGGINVDSGATNRKLGSDMGDAVTGGGLHGKDLSKADVSINIWAHILANAIGQEVRVKCAIGDEIIEGTSYSKIVSIARDYIKRVGGFEKFAEWGLIR